MRATAQLHPDAPPPRKPKPALVHTNLWRFGELNESAVVTFSELREWLGESRAGLLRFVVAGVVPRLPDGRFRLKQNVEAYLAYWAAIVAALDAGEAGEA